jgi:DNA-binding response OmpR family regulator
MRRRRILIVEDDLASRNALAQILSVNHDVTVASDGIEGAEAAHRIEPDLIVTDVTMPRLDGLTMVRYIRERQAWKVPVIFLTALGSPADVIAGIAAGARNYLTKPIDVAELERRVARALGLPIPT